MFDVIGLTSKRIYSGPMWWSCRMLTHKGNHMFTALVFPLFASESCLSPVTYMNTDHLTQLSRLSVSVGGTIWALNQNDCVLQLLKYVSITVGTDQPAPKLQSLFYLQDFLCKTLLLMLCLAGFLGLCK